MGIAFTCYEAVSKHPPAAVAAAPHLAALWPTVAGGAAGFVSKIAIYPLDTLKKRIQAQVVLADAGGLDYLSYQQPSLFI
jgi:Mitochondrial carrier protein